MTAAPDMSDPDGPLAGAPIKRVEAQAEAETGTGNGVSEEESNLKSRWSSTSSDDTDLDNFWHDSVCSSTLGVDAESDQALFVTERTLLVYVPADNAHRHCRITSTQHKTQIAPWNPLISTMTTSSSDRLTPVALGFPSTGVRPSTRWRVCPRLESDQSTSPARLSQA